MGKRPRKNKYVLSRKDTPDVLEEIDKQFISCQKRNHSTLELIESKLETIRKTIPNLNQSNLFHKRNKLLQKYLKLCKRKDQLQERVWQQQFLESIRPILSLYEEVFQKDTKHAEVGELPTPTRTPLSFEDEESACIRLETKESIAQSLDEKKEMPISMTQLHETFLAQFKRDELKTSLMNKQASEECPNPKCQGHPLLLILKEARLVCTRCGLYVKSLTSSSNGLHFSEENDHHTPNAYERKKNFRAYLNQFSENAKPIPPDLIRYLQHELRNSMVTSKSECRTTRVKELIRANEKYRKYVDSASRLTTILNNRPVPRFTQEQIDKFVKMFEDTQIPFQSLPKSSRQNFLNSSVLINRFLGVLNLKHFQRAFPLLRHKRTLHLQLSLWGELAKQLGYPYEEGM